MTRLAVGLIVLGILPLPGAEMPKGPKRSLEVTTTERFPFAPGGIIRLENSYGYVAVEGWEEQEVEVTITKSSDRLELLDQVRVATELRSDTELSISTTLPHRNSLLTSVLPSGRIIVTTPLPPNNKRGVTVEYRIRAPRNSRLTVHHDNGYVWVSDVTGDIDIRSHTGDLTILLPDPGPYAIDARTGLGRIDSDVACKASHPLLTGGRVLCPAPAPAPRVRLRMGRGSIAIKTGPPLSPFLK